MRLTVMILAILVLSASAAPSALGETVTFKMTGTITASQPTPPPGVGAFKCAAWNPLPFPIGQQAVLTYTFESTTPDANPADPWGWYATPSSVTFTTASYVGTGTEIGIYVDKYNNSGVALDWYEVDIPGDTAQFMTGPSVPTGNGFDVVPQGFVLEALSTQTTADDSLPSTPPSIDTPYSMWVLQFSNQYCLFGTVASLERVNSGYTFTGFFPPVDAAPTLNIMKSGAAVPVKFSLNGDQGPQIFASGFPASQSIACDSSEPTDAIEETVAAGGSTLSYDVSSDTYTYVWKTNKAWANSCRLLTVKLSDGSEHKAAFKFSK